MKYHVVYDRTGRILALGPVEQPSIGGKGPVLRCGPQAKGEESAAILDLPASFTLSKLAAQANQLRVVHQPDGVKLVPAD